MSILSDEQLAELEREEREALLEEEERDEFFAAAAEAPRMRKELERMREALARRTEKLGVETQLRARAEGARDEARAAANREREGKGKRPVRLACDVCAFGELVEAKKRRRPGGGRLSEEEAILEAWREVPGLPQNLHFSTKRRDFEEWLALKERLKRNPTPEEYRESRPRPGRPKKST